MWRMSFGWRFAKLSKETLEVKTLGTILIMFAFRFEKMLATRKERYMVLGLALHEDASFDIMRATDMRRVSHACMHAHQTQSW